MVTFPSLQGDLHPQPQVCEGIMFLMGTAVLNNVAKLYRLWASVFISLREQCKIYIGKCTFLLVYTIILLESR